ncbi:MAG: ATP-binding protein, partial [Ornithinimicrobium sp.]
DMDAELERAAKDGQWPDEHTERKPSRPRTTQAEEESMVDKVVGSSAFRSMMRSAGTVIGREISRSVFGTAKRRPRK